MTCLKLEDVLLEEAKAIHPDKKPVSGSYQELLRLESTALCISGGGIRSASFSQGVIEALACHPRPGDDKIVESEDKSLLAQFNYLSTVSGGGYVGSWLSAWLARAHKPGVNGWPGVWKSLSGQRNNPDKEPAQITWLRTYSNYLTPRLGLTSADTWAAITIFLRNMILNWFVLLPVLVGILLCLKLAAIAAVGFSSPGPGNGLEAPIFWALVALGSVGIVAALYYSNAQRPTHHRTLQRRLNPEERKVSAETEFLIWDLVPGSLAAVFLTLSMALPPARALAASYFVAEGGRPSFRGMAVLAVSGGFLAALGWITAWLKRPYRAPDFVAWIISGVIFGFLVALGIYLYFASPARASWPFPAKEILLLTFGVPWGIMSGLVAEMIFVGLTKDVPGSDTDREWLGRAGGWYLLVALAWPIGVGLVLCGSVLAESLFGQLSTWIAAGGAGSITAFLGKSQITSAKREGLTGKILSLNVLLAVAAIVFAVALVIALSALLDRILFGGSLTAADAIPGVFWIGVALAVAWFIGWVASRHVNINRFSLHALYRNRIIRGFLGASNENREQTRNKFTDFDEADNLRVHDLWPRNPPVGADNWRPFHVINMALNLAATKNLAWQERKAESFTVSPLHSGNSDLGYRDSKTYGDGDGISLGTAVAISGAAASPNMGYHSSPALALLLTLFNVRLGWWLGNPGVAGNQTYKESGPPKAVKPLLWELFGQTTNTADYVYLSDGGHFENLGLYEMVRRRCRYIVVIDAGCDRPFAFEDLGNAVRKISIDLGVEITFENLKGLKFREEKNVRYADKQPPFYAFGVIHYPEAEKTKKVAKAEKVAMGDKRSVASGHKHGSILYIKPCFLDARITNAGVRNYAAANPDFPHQSTANQWFSESQLESYRALGFEMMDEVLNEIADIAAKSKVPKKNLNLEAIFKILEKLSKIVLHP
jgi:hypothetical protein